MANLGVVREADIEYEGALGGGGRRRRKRGTTCAVVRPIELITFLPS